MSNPIDFQKCSSNFSMFDASMGGVSAADLKAFGEEKSLVGPKKVEK